jgi:hypothetical protein
MVEVGDTGVQSLGSPTTTKRNASGTGPPTDLRKVPEASPKGLSCLTLVVVRI